MVMESLPLGWWDGQPIHVKDMIREIHRVTNRSRAFKFQELADQLADMGCSVDMKTGNVSKTPPPETNPHH